MSEANVTDIEDWGSVEVTNKCCGAMTCRVLAPGIFLEAKDLSTKSSDESFTYVGRPVKNEDEYRQVRRAVVACPFHALRFTSRPPPGKTTVSGDVNADYPLPLSLPDEEEEVYLLGYFSPKIAGASTYLIKRPEGRNVMIDAPRPDDSLLQKVKDLGGVKYIIFTHKDHTGFFAEWSQALEGQAKEKGEPGVTPVIHAKDVVDDKKHYFFARTTPAEIKVAGFKAQWLDGEEGDIRMIPIPGHTHGSMAIIYKDKYIFTGDSLHWSAPRGHLISSRFHCWENWPQQIKSLQKLADYKWQYVLPGHGDQHRFASHQEAQQNLEQCLQWMHQQKTPFLQKTPLLQFVAWFKLRTTTKSPAIRWLTNNVLMPEGGPGTSRRRKVVYGIFYSIIVWMALNLWKRLRGRVGGGQALLLLLSGRR